MKRSHEEAKASEDRRKENEREATGVVVVRESRVHRRVAARLDARLSTLDPSEAGPDGARYYLITNATTLDIAEGGLGLESDGALASGQRVVVELDLGDGRVIERKGRVAWQSEDLSGRHFLGVTFDELIRGFVVDPEHES